MKKPVLVLLLGAIFALPAWSDEPVASDVAKAVKELQEAASLGDDIVIVEAIERAAHVTHPDVIAEVKKALDSKSSAVKSRAIEALGWMKHPDALEALHDLYWNEPRLGENENMFAKLLKAIGRQGDPSSVKVLSHKPFKYLTWDVGVARIMAPRS